ncbi:MAG: hypothetical protein ACI8UZ_003554 [Akkermansiaceae bacterium]
MHIRVVDTWSFPNFFDCLRMSVSQLSMKGPESRDLCCHPGEAGECFGKVG